MIFIDLHPTARVAVVLAALSMAACASGSPPPPSGGGEPAIYAGDSQIDQDPDAAYIDDLSDTSSAGYYDRLFIEIHTDLIVELNSLEKSGKGGTRLEEIHSLVKTAEEFYLEGKPLIAIRLLTEAELLLRQVP